MTRSVPTPLPDGCPKCQSKKAISLYFEDNHGYEFHMEDHCSECGWHRTPEGLESNSFDEDPERGLTQPKSRGKEL